MDNKKEINGSIKIAAYIILILFGIFNIVLFRLCYGFFGFDTGVTAIFLNSILIVIVIIFLSIKNMYKKRNIRFLRVMGIIIVMVYPIIISIAQIFSLFEFRGIAFDIRNFTIFKDTYIFLNIPVFLIILIITNIFSKKSYIE